MADAISTAAAQGPSSAAGVYSEVAASSNPSPAALGSPLPSASQAAPAAAPATPATKLDMSPASGLSNQDPATAPMSMEQAAQVYQAYLNNLPSDLLFQPDYQAGLLVFKVVNPVTNQVIRQLPPEAVVEQARNLRMASSKANSGIILDDSL